MSKSIQHVVDKISGDLRLVELYLIVKNKEISMTALISIV